MAEGLERDVFISHEKNDGAVALELAALLRQTGYSTWCYEEDSMAGGSYLVQIDRAIEAARSMVVIVSPHSLRSPHVRSEIVRAYECQKRFIPIRLGMAHEDLLTAHDAGDDDRRREWRMAFGAAVSVPWDAADPESVVERVAEGLRRVGISPRGGEPSHAEPSHAEPSHAAQPHAAQPDAAPAPKPPSAVSSRAPRSASVPGPPSGLPLSTSSLPLRGRVLFAAMVGVLGALLTVWMLYESAAVKSGYWGFHLVPFMRWINMLASAVGLWLSIRLILAALRLFRGNGCVEGEIRRVAGIELLLVAAWLAGGLLVKFTASGGTASLLQHVITIALTGGALVAILRFLLFRTGSDRAEA